MFLDCVGGRKGSLYTIPFSHYCELARWSLQIAKIPFNEHPYLPGIHMFFGPMERIRKRASQQGTGEGAGTPLYVTYEGEVLDDSWRVLELAGRGSVPERIKIALNDIVGPHTRTLVYADMLREEMDARFLSVGQACPVPAWQRWMWGLKPFRRTVASKMWEGMVKNDEFPTTCMKELDKTLTELEVEIAKPDGAFAATPDGSPSASTLALAALLAPLVLPEEYTAGYAPKFTPDMFSDVFQKRMQACRERSAGRLVLSTYKTYRLDAIGS
eukprot:TRINITY_DN8767_c0_g4_i1.p1 TRINITY_DN8767_c0_g4~~TRINITY_DN8767_c0_g4_i1.p1  ORF type:complete len:271 (+),score=24.76 TRINITY_DN8767_c0_g4_i1:53-865(+)